MLYMPMVILVKPYIPVQLRDLVISIRYSISSKEPGPLNLRLKAEGLWLNFGIDSFSLIWLFPAQIAPQFFNNMVIDRIHKRLRKQNA